MHAVLFHHKRKEILLTRKFVICLFYSDDDSYKEKTGCLEIPFIP